SFGDIVPGFLKNRALFCLAAAVALSVGSASAQDLPAAPSPVAPSASAPVAIDALYADAVAKETAVRQALAGPNPDVLVLKAVRTGVSDFENIVRLSPTSGYCDYALWRGGLPSPEAFNKLGDTRDRDAGIRLLRALASRYPTSKLARHVPDLLATLDVSSVQ